MPRFDVKFRVLTIRDRLPTRREHRFHDWLGKEFVSRRRVQTINACAKSFRGAERLSGMAGGCVDTDGLCRKPYADG
jgi:hypothetical protein